MKLPIPITVLTGFLGSGKTTLLKALLEHPDMAGTAVIVNEFGEVGLDDALIEGAEEDIILLPSGCVCCAVRGDLVEALNRLYDRMGSSKHNGSGNQNTGGPIPEITRIVLETSGLADPAPIAHTLMTEEDLFRIYQLDGVVTTVDAELGLAQIEEHFEPAKQIAVADRIVLTKTDRAGVDAIIAIKARIHALNPTAELRQVTMGETSPDLVTGLAAFEPVAAKAHAEGWLGAEAYGHDDSGKGEHDQVARHDCASGDCDHPGHKNLNGFAQGPHRFSSEHGHSHYHGNDHGHSHGIRSFSLTFDEPIDGQKLSFAIELLRTMHGEKLLRVKGIAAVEGEPLPFVIHGVQHIFYPPTTLDKWPSDDRRSRFVFITKDLDKVAVESVFGPIFSNAPVPPGAFSSD